MQKLSSLRLLFLSFCFLLYACEDSALSSSNSDVISPGGTGQGGSMARFAVTGNYLYIVDRSSLHVYDVQDPGSPAKIKEVTLGINIETIFPYQDMLFIGSQDGMHIYNIAEPANPRFLSIYQHVTSCDPVVVQGNRAYVTLRSGNSCMRGRNQLDILDISVPAAPRLIASYPMKNPFGLGIDGNTLFVCEGQHGLKVLNVEDPLQVQEIHQVPDLHAFDVIPLNNNLILTGNDGLFQYSYAQPEELSLSSKLPISNCE